MSKPIIHARSSAKKYGGIPEDYLELHTFMDLSKGALGDNRHRALTHQAAFLVEVLPAAFGETFVRASDGKVLSSRDIGEMHCGEDYHGFIPTAEDFLQLVPMRNWMDYENAGTVPASIESREDALRRSRYTEASYDANQFLNDLRLVWHDLPADKWNIMERIVAVMDYGKKFMNDLRWRALTYNSWFINHIIPRIFGSCITLDTGETFSPENIAGLYVDLQYGYIPTAQDWFVEMPMTPWMNNGKGNPPPSFKGLRSHFRTVTVKFDTD
jgi:hypothetical protein